MKYIFTLLVSITCFFGITNSQAVQTFETLTNLNTLTNNCWQFLGASLFTTPAAGTKSLSVNAASVGGKAWVYTPYADLTTSSTISFTYQLEKKLSSTASRTISVRLLGLDGTYVTAGTITLDDKSSATPYTFAGKSPLTGVRKVVIEITSAGDDFTTLYLDNISVAGTFNYNPPYWCKDRSNGTTTIHYLKVFQGLLAADRVHLQWTVAENENNQYFDIERSGDGKDFHPVATVKATSRVAVENYTHQESLSTSAYYRLKLVSKTGIRMYSNVLYFKNGSPGQGLSLLQNPVQQTLKLGFTAERKTTAMVTVYDMSGFKVFQREYQAGKGYNVVSADLNTNLKKGLYFLELIQEENKSTTKFIKE